MGPKNENKNLKDNDIQVPDESYKSETYHNYFLEKMCILWKENRLADVILQADKIRIPAHKIVLSTATEYFSVMFESDLKKKQTTIKITGVRGETLKDIVNYIYTGTIYLRKSNIVSIVSAASLLQCTEIEELCCEYLEKHINSSNCLQITSLAKRLTYNKLRQRSTDYTVKNFEKIYIKPQFLHLPYLDLKQLIKNKNLVCKRDIIFESVVLWLQHNWVLREKYALNLLNLVNLSLVSPNYLLHRACKIFGNDHKCLLLITKALAEINSMGVYEQMKSNECTQTSSMRVLSIIENRSLIFATYNPVTKSWSETITDVKLPSHLGFHLTFACNKLFTCNDIFYLFSFDMTTKIQEQNSFPDPGPRLGTSITVIEHDSTNYDAYIMGGIDLSDVCTTVVSRWRSQSRSWTKMAPMLSALYDCKTVVVDKKIYVIGGRTKQHNEVKNVEVYDTRTNTWQKCKPMIKEMYYFSVTAFGKFIYVLGGFYNYVFRYDTENDSWTSVASLPNERCYLSSCVFQNKLLAIGGQDANKEWLKTVDEYDPEKDKWQPFKPMLSRVQFSVAINYP